MQNNEKLDAYEAVISALDPACLKINEFCRDVLRTRGGRIGSGMGGLLEALWGYEVNNVLRSSGQDFCELAWFPEHQYHDFACVRPEQPWDSASGVGEFFRIEAKSMNSGADESKAHFDVLSAELGDFDALLVLIWNWTDLDEYHCCPQVTDSFFGRAKPIAELRDVLHIERGGSFVSRDSCPDSCNPQTCTHHGEPLNERGKRERLSGPESSRPSQRVSYSANFGGLVRMLKTRGQKAKMRFRTLRKQDSTIDNYISFVHRNYPAEELNHFSVSEWRELAKKYNISSTDGNPLKKKDIYAIVKRKNNYQDLLKEF